MKFETFSHAKPSLISTTNDQYLVTDQLVTNVVTDQLVTNVVTDQLVTHNLKILCHINYERSL